MTRKSRRPAGARATMAQVARLAGVSAQTVSRVVNGQVHVEAPTKERVLAAIDELDFRPHPAAQSLASGRFSALGVLTYSLTAFGDSHKLDALTRAAQQANISVRIVAVLRDPKGLRSPEMVRQAFRQLVSQGVDGIVLTNGSAVPALSEADLAAVPVVAADHDVAGMASVDLDSAAAAQQATEYLLGLGHRTVHHLAGAQHTHPGRAMRHAWEATLAAAGVAVPEPKESDWSPADGYRLGAQFADDPAVTAVLVASDEMALAAMKALRERGRRVPQDVSVVGIGDIDQAAYGEPPLTTFRGSHQAIGEQCLTWITTGVEDPDVFVGIPMELVERASAAPATE